MPSAAGLILCAAWNALALPGRTSRRLTWLSSTTKTTRTRARPAAVTERDRQRPFWPGALALGASGSSSSSCWSWASGVPERAQGARLRELRPRPDVDRRPSRDQLSDDFFGRLEDPGNLTPLSLEAEITADRGHRGEPARARARASTPPTSWRRRRASWSCLRAAQRRPHRDRRPDRHRAGNRGRKDAKLDRRLHALLPRQRRPLRASARGDQHRARGPGHRARREAAGEPFLPDERWLDRRRPQSTSAACRPAGRGECDGRPRPGAVSNDGSSQAAPC